MAKVEGVENQALHDRSGQVVFNHIPLVGFLYDAMRDGLISPGDAEELVRRNTTGIDYSAYGAVAFCNGYLAKYSYDLARRLSIGSLIWSDDKPDDRRIGVHNEKHDRN